MNRKHRCIMLVSVIALVSLVLCIIMIFIAIFLIIKIHVFALNSDHRQVLLGLYCINIQFMSCVCLNFRNSEREIVRNKLVSFIFSFSNERSLWWSFIIDGHPPSCVVWCASFLNNFTFLISYLNLHGHF